MNIKKIALLLTYVLVQHISAAEISLYSGFCKGHRLSPVVTGDFGADVKMIKKTATEPERRAFDIEVMYGRKKPTSKKIGSLKESLGCNVLGQEKGKLGTRVSSGLHSFTTLRWREANADPANPGTVEYWEAKIPSWNLMLTGFIVIYEGGKYRINFDAKGATSGSHFEKAVRISK